MSHYLLSEVAVEPYSWPFPPFDENSQPTNGLTFDDFTARVDLNPKVLEAEPPLDQ